MTILPLLVASLLASILSASASVLYTYAGPQTVNGTDFTLPSMTVTRDGSASDTLYFRYTVVNPQSNSGTENYFAGMELFSGGTEVLGVGNAWGPSAYSTFGMVGGDLKSSTPESGQVWQLVRSTDVTTIIWKVKFNSGANDDVTVWLNPDLTTSEAAQTSSRTTTYNFNCTFDSIRLRCGGGGSGWTYQNIAIADTAVDIGFTAYAVTYNGNGNTGGSVPTDSSSPYSPNSTVKVLGNTGGLTKTGYNFVGWTTYADGSGTLFAEGNQFNITGNTTLYAYWTAQTPPSITSATASPSTANLGDNVTLSVTVTPGSSPTINSVVVNASAIGGSSSLALAAAGGGVYTNTVTVTSATAYGSALTLPATATDANGLPGSANISLTVNSPTLFTWNGGSGNWSAVNWMPNSLATPLIAGPTSGSAQAVITNGTVNLDVNHVAINSLTMGGGELQAAVGSLTTFGTPIQVNGTGNVIAAPSGFDFALNGNLTGSGTVSTGGQYAVMLGGNNAGFNGTWISGSQDPNNLTWFGNANSGSASAAWVLNGGRMVNGNGSSPTISLGSLSGTGGILSNNSGGQVTYSVGGLNTDATFSGQIVNEWGGGGTTAITKVGSGIWTLSGNLAYTGATVINGGNLVIHTGLDYAVPSTSGYTLGNNSKLTFYSTNNPMIDKAITGTGDLYIDGTGAGNQYENRVNITGNNNTFNGNVYVTATGKLAFWNNGALPAASVWNVAGLVSIYGLNETMGGLTGSGIVQGNNSVLTVANGTDQTFSGTLRKNPDEGGTFTLTKTGSGTLTLSGTTDNSDAHAVIESGTLVLAKDSSGVHALGSTKTNALTINGGVCRLDGMGSDQIYDLSNVEMAGGTFDLNGREEGFCGLSGSGGTITNNSSDFARLAVGTGSLAGEVYTFAGTIQDGTNQVGLTKTGAGTLVLTGTSSYTDFTTVDGGTLQVDGSLGNTEVSVSSAALAGNGAIGGVVYIDNGGNLATRISNWSGTAGSGFDDLSVQSLQILAGTPHVVTVDVAALTNFSEVAKTFPFLHASGGISGFSADEFSVAVPGFTGTGTWKVGQNGNNLELVYTPGSSSPYGLWADRKGLTAENDGQDMDPDHDGLTNLQEFAFDGDPLSSANGGKSFAGIADPDGVGPESNTLLLTIPVRDGAVFNGPGDLVSDPVDGIVYQIQGSLDLLDWTTMNVSEVTPAYAGGLPALSSGWSYRTFRTPGPVGSPNVRSFLRVGVLAAP